MDDNPTFLRGITSPQTPTSVPNQSTKRSQPASLVALMENLPAARETWVQSLGQEDPLEEGMATHSSILAWRILRTEEPAGLQSTGSDAMEAT